MRIPIDEVVHIRDVVTHDPETGAATDADAAPTFDVFEENTDTPILDDQAMTKRTSLTGNYRGSFTASAANGFEAGKWYNVVVTATVGGITAKCVVMHFVAVPAETSAGVPQVRASAIADGAIAAATLTANTISAAALDPDVATELNASVLALLVGLAPTTGTVTADAGNSATSFETDLAQTVTDYWKDAWLLLTSGTMAGQIKRVTAYNGSTKIITVSGGFTGTPADGVTFTLINR